MNPVQKSAPRSGSSVSSPPNTPSQKVRPPTKQSAAGALGRDVFEGGKAAGAQGKAEGTPGRAAGVSGRAAGAPGRAAGAPGRAGSVASRAAEAAGSAQ